MWLSVMELDLTTEHLDNLYNDVFSAIQSFRLNCTWCIDRIVTRSSVYTVDH